MNLDRDFQTLCDAIRARQNWLRGLRLSIGLLFISLPVSLVVLILVQLWPSIVPQPPWAIVLAINGAVGLLGFLWGRRRPVDLAQALLHADRYLRLGERLCTWHELRQQAQLSAVQDALLPAIQRPVDLESVRYRLNEVYPLRAREKRQLAGVMALGLLFVGLWAGGDAALWRLESPAAESAQAGTAAEGKRDPQALSDPRSLEIRTPNEALNFRLRAEELAQRARRGLISDSQLTSEIAAAEHAETAMWGLSSAAGVHGELAGQSPGDPEAQQDALDERRARARQAQQDLKQLSEQLKNAAMEAPTRAQLRQKLQQLSESLEGSPELQARLQQAAEANSGEELAEALDRALTELDEKLASDEELRRSRNALRQAMEHATPDDQRSDSADDPSAADARGDRASQGRGAPASEAAPRGNHDPTDSPAGSSSPAGEEQPGQRAGSEAGTDADRGQRRPASSSEELKATRPLRMPTQSAPDVQVLKRLALRGMPLDDLTVDPAQGVISAELNFAKLDAFMTLREVPAELRSLVRLYFLSLAEPSPSP